MNLIRDVWSNTSEQTQPPLLHGETTIIGTRMPRPYGPLAFPRLPPKISTLVSTVDRPSVADRAGVGGTRWSKNPSFSSYVTKRAVLLHTRGFDVRASSTCVDAAG